MQMQTPRSQFVTQSIQEQSGSAEDEKFSGKILVTAVQLQKVTSMFAYAGNIEGAMETGATFLLILLCVSSVSSQTTTDNQGMELEHNCSGSEVSIQ